MLGLTSRKNDNSSESMNFDYNTPPDLRRYTNTRDFENGDIIDDLIDESDFDHPFRQRYFEGNMGATDCLVDENDKKLTDRHHSIIPIGKVEYWAKTGASETVYIDKGEEVIKGRNSTQDDIADAVSYWAAKQYDEGPLPEGWDQLRSAIGLFINHQDLYESVNDEYDDSSDMIAETIVDESSFREFFDKGTEKYPSEAHYLWGEVMDGVEHMVIDDLFSKENEIQPENRVLENGEKPKVQAFDKDCSIDFVGEAEAVVGIDSYNLQEEFEWINGDDYELVVSVEVPKENSLEVISNLGSNV